jgi:hypothetical protein
MNQPTEAALARPFLASDVIGIVFCLFALAYGFLWWRDRDQGMGWFTATWLLYGVWFSSTPYQPVASPFIAWSPWWYVVHASFIALTLGIISHLRVPLELRGRVLFWTLLPIVVSIAAYQLPLLGFKFGVLMRILLLRFGFLR